MEVKCFELQDKLEEEGKLEEDEIEEQVDALRKQLLDELERGGGAAAGDGRVKVKGLKAHQVHELAEAKLRENERFEKALGIALDYQEVRATVFRTFREREREYQNSPRTKDGWLTGNGNIQGSHWQKQAQRKLERELGEPSRNLRE